MRFYYFSLFSWLAYAIVVAVVLPLLWLVWTRILKLKTANPTFWVLIAAIVVGPWVEELWIAYNFDRLCRKDAGAFINRTVEVDGFYDDTRQWWRQLQESGYQFVESREYGTKNYWRVELLGGGVRHFKIDQPTARYHYRTVNNAMPVAHQIKRFEDVVLDNQTGEILGRYTNYTRGAYWFFISLDRPIIECVEIKGKDPRVYREVLKQRK
jgi:hypothetical protein